MSDEQPNRRPTSSYEFSSENRLVSERPQGLNVKDIEDKTSGNYLFSLGLPGSGKTTIQWMMINYLLSVGAYQTRLSIPDRADGSSDYEGRRIINEWKDLWKSGTFPERTSTSDDDIREVSIATRPTYGKKIDLNFSFLEMSGELLKMAIPTKTASPDISPIIRAYLANESLRFVILMMIDPHTDNREDYDSEKFVASTRDFLEKEFPGLQDRSSLGIILSKPDASLARMNHFGGPGGRRDYKRFDEEAIEDYLSHFAQEAFSYWENWPTKRSLLSPLYVGETQEIEGKPRLIRADYAHIEQIIIWLFEQFTGKTPGRTWWQNLKERVNFE